MSKAWRFIVGCSVAVFLCVTVISGLFIFYLFSPNKDLKQNTTFLIDRGDSIQKLSSKLHSGKIINHSYPIYPFYMMARAVFYRNQLKSGEYLINKNARIYDIFKKLTSKDIYYRKITFEEGITTNEILLRVSELSILQGQVPSDIKEGELLPDTYFYTYGETKSNLVMKMRRTMTDFLDKAWEQRDPKLPIKTKQEALILASIVEKETSLPDERKKIAGVFMNRLKKKMKLQSDPTVMYELTKGKYRLERLLTNRDLRSGTSYNTYNIPGLPLAPISNPSRESIRAVLNPIATKDLYFVANGLGGHHFSETYAEHLKRVIEYRAFLKNNEDIILDSAGKESVRAPVAKQ